MALFLQRVVRRGDALHRDLRGLELKGLLGLGREHELALHNKSRADVLVRDLVVIGQIPPVEHDLQALVAGEPSLSSTKPKFFMSLIVLTQPQTVISRSANAAASA